MSGDLNKRNARQNPENIKRTTILIRGVREKSLVLEKS
jgi:hypothetical protein